MSAFLLCTPAQSLKVWRRPERYQASHCSSGCLRFQFCEVKLEFKHCFVIGLFITQSREWRCLRMLSSPDLAPVQWYLTFLEWLGATVQFLTLRVLLSRRWWQPALALQCFHHFTEVNMNFSACIQPSTQLKVPPEILNAFPVKKQEVWTHWYAV